MTNAGRYVLVLAGGRGERFWPWSRADRPKQLLPLAGGGRTLLAATLERALALTAPDHVIVLTAADLVAAVQREAPPGVRVLGEPVARNTAAAIGAGAHLIGGNHAFAVLYADHLIEDAAAFHADLERGFEVAEREEVLVIFGVPPAGPDTNFGYIRRGARVADGLHRVAQFTEKPDLARAQAWVAGGEHLWNAGIFVWRAGVFLKALEVARPALARALAPLRGVPAKEFEAALGRVFPAAESIAVDYAVLERAPNVLMLEAAFDWDDVGSWGAWARRQPHDSRGNVVVGDVVPIDCDECVLVGDGASTTAALGLKRMIVVHADGATLVCPLESSDQVRKVSEAVRAREGR